MTIGEKIAQLRTEANISQEWLAERLAVSRQSISKWEMNQATPQVDNILQTAINTGDASGAAAGCTGNCATCGGCGTAR